MQFQFNRDEFQKWCEKYGLYNVNPDNVDSIHLDEIRPDTIRLSKKAPYNDSTISFKDISILHKLQNAIQNVSVHIKEITVNRDGEILIQNRPSSFRSLKEELNHLNQIMIAAQDCVQDWPHEKLQYISDILDLISTDSMSIKGPLASELEKEIQTFTTQFAHSANKASTNS